MPTKEPFRVIIQDTEAIPRKEWLLARKPAVCSSDYPAVVGLSRFKTAVDVFADKRTPDVPDEEITLEQKYRFEIGHAIEPVMHTAVAHLIGALPIRDKRMCESTIYPHMRSDVDGLFLMQNDRVIQGVPFKKGDIILYEGKTTNPRSFAEWTASPPDMYVAQTKHAMLVQGIKYALLVICKGNDLKNDLLYHLISLEEDDKQIIPFICKDFMERHVQTGNPPAEALGPYASDHKKALASYYGQSAKNDGSSLNLPWTSHLMLERALAVRAELADLNAQVRAKENERDAIEVPLIDMLGDKYQSGVLESVFRTITAGYSVSRRNVMNAENITRLAVEKPELFATLMAEGYICEQVERRFSVKSKDKKTSSKRKRAG